MSHTTTAQIQSLATAVAANLGSVTRHQFEINYTSAIGPAYVESTGSPSTTPPVGTVFRDLNSNNLYLYTSAGWSAPMAVSVSPIIGWTEGMNFPPASYLGTTGDYIIDVSNLVVYGPKTGVSPFWSGTPLHSWSLLALSGPPGPTDGVEGDWAWYEFDASNLHVYGPKMASGWAATYETVNHYSPISTVQFQNTDDATGGDIRISPGFGAYSTSSYGNSFESGGYTRMMSKLESATIVLGSEVLIIGAEMVTSACTPGSTTPVCTIYGDGVSLGGTLNATLSRTSFNTLFDGSSQTLQIGLSLQSSYGSDLSDVTTWQSTVTVYTAKMVPLPSQQISQ